MRTHLIGFAWVLLTAVTCSVWSTVRAQSLPSPVDRAQVTQAFAAYGAVKPGKYHTGIDLSPLSSSYAARRQQAVKAVLEGKVVHIFGLRLSNGKWYVRWWDNGTGTTRWVTGMPYVRAGSSRGLGICIILEHEGSPTTYTLYGHLDAVRAHLKIGDMVRQGEEIGLVGNSGQDSRGRDYLRFCPADAHNHAVECEQGIEQTEIVVARDGGFAPHLHFEVKYQPVLGDTSSLPGVGEAGYTSYDPFYPPPRSKTRSYADPFLWLYRAKPLSSSSVEIVARSVSAHIGPGDYPQSTSFNSGQKFKAVASATSAWPADRARWYLVEAHDGALFPHPGGGEVPRVWICEGTATQRWAELYGPPNIQIHITAEPSNPKLLSTVTISVRVVNAGGRDAVNSTVNCEIPAMTSYVPGSLIVDGKSQPDPYIVEGRFQVPLALLEPGKEVWIRYQVKVQ
ncbi:MAG: peptidoglycan DD-metalloendopeptidase family protein [bacterium]|nr:peptidoglycan DD-metalloendopeptidase family protein [bacterium]